MSPLQAINHFIYMVIKTTKDYYHLVNVSCCFMYNSFADMSPVFNCVKLIFFTASSNTPDRHEIAAILKHTETSFKNNYLIV